jgi:hypothetical protein
MPECFYRASIVFKKMDSRQKHAGMTEIGIEAIRHVINNLNNLTPLSKKCAEHY